MYPTTEGTGSVDPINRGGQMVGDAGREADRQAEINRLEAQIERIANTSALEIGKLAQQLADAEAEVARLKAENDLLERRNTVLVDGR